MEATFKLDRERTNYYFIMFVKFDMDEISYIASENIVLMD